MSQKSARAQLYSVFWASHKAAASYQQRGCGPTWRPRGSRTCSLAYVDLVPHGLLDRGPWIFSECAWRLISVPVMGFSTMATGFITVCPVRCSSGHRLVEVTITYAQHRKDILPQSLSQTPGEGTAGVWNKHRKESHGNLRSLPTRVRGGTPSQSPVGACFPSGMFWTARREYAQTRDLVHLLSLPLWTLF